MTYPTRKEAEDHALLLSLLAGEPDEWLVVDVGTIDKAEFRVWRERTIQNAAECPYYELVSRADAGKLTRIA